MTPALGQASRSSLPPSMIGTSIFARARAIAGIVAIATARRIFRPAVIVLFMN
jgi:hypothetical protein